MIEETNRIEVNEMSNNLNRDPTLLGELSEARIRDHTVIPNLFESKNDLLITGVKKYCAQTPIAKTKIHEQLATLS